MFTLDFIVYNSEENIIAWFPGRIQAKVKVVIDFIDQSQYTNRRIIRISTRIPAGSGQVQYKDTGRIRSSTVQGYRPGPLKYSTRIPAGSGLVQYKDTGWVGSSTV